MFGDTFNFTFHAISRAHKGVKGLSVELDVVYQKYLDESTYCELCNASMMWIEGEFNSLELQYHVCTNCGHSYLPEKSPSPCQCKHCLEQRRKTIRETLKYEKYESRQKNLKSKDQLEILLDDVSFLDKLFTLALLDGAVREGASYNEHLNFNHIYALDIAPNYQLFNQLVKKFKFDLFLIPMNPTIEDNCFYLNFKLKGYSEPSLMALTEQLRHWFYGNFTKGIPYKTADEVKDVLLTILAHEAIRFCSIKCGEVGVQFVANNKLVEFCKEVLNVWSPTQLFHQIQNAIDYLKKAKLLEASNVNFINTNMICKTLEKYRQVMAGNKWEVGIVKRPDYPYSQMTNILLFEFLGFKENAFNQPLWKNWNDALPTLRFFEECHCIHCGGYNLFIDHKDDENISFTCSDCKMQDHYFIK